MIRGLRDLYLYVSDMPRAVRFYRDVLKIPVSKQEQYWTALDLNGVTLGLHWTGGDAVPAIAHDEEGPFNGCTITLEVEDIDIAVKHLHENGAEILGEIKRNPWGSIVSFKDPDGNVLKLLQPPP